MFRDIYILHQTLLFEKKLRKIQFTIHDMGSLSYKPATILQLYHMDLHSLLLKKKKKILSEMVILEKKEKYS